MQPSLLHKVVKKRFCCCDKEESDCTDVSVPVGGTWIFIAEWCRSSL